MENHLKWRTRLPTGIGQPKPNAPAGEISQFAALRTASISDLKFIDHLQRKFANALGWLPNQALERLIGMQVIYTALENDEPAGYIVSRRRLRWQPKMRSITQAAVAMDAQRRHHGLALLSRIAAEAQADGLQAIQACCAVGLESNEFWHAAGFMPICHMTPQNLRNREVICWRLPLVESLPTWFAMPPDYSGVHGHATKSQRDPWRDVHALAEALNYKAATPTPRILPCDRAREEAQ